MTGRAAEGFDVEGDLAQGAETCPDLHGEDRVRTELGHLLDRLDDNDREQRHFERYGCDDGDQNLIERSGLHAPLVFELGNMRSLLANWAFVQSIMSIDDPDRLTLDYTRQMMGFLPSQFGLVTGSRDDELAVDALREKSGENDDHASAFADPKFKAAVLQTANFLSWKLSLQINLGGWLPVDRCKASVVSPRRISGTSIAPPSETRKPGVAVGPGAKLSADIAVMPVAPSAAPICAAL